MEEVDMKYAGFWRRALAVIIDGAFIVGYYYLVDYIILLMTKNPYFLPRHGLLVAWLIVIIYTVLMECGESQGTVGKMIVRAKVITTAGKRIGFLRAVVRNVIKPVSLIVLGIGVIIAAFEKKKRSLHDFIAATFVVNT